MRSFLMLLSLLWLTGCQTSPVEQDFDTSRSFLAYTSWSWAEPAVSFSPADDPRVESDLTRQRIMQAVADQLLQRGVLPAAEGQPGSLRVRTHLIVEPREEKVVISHGMAVGGYWGGGWAGGPVISETRSINSREATLQIDLIDAASDELVWRGSDRMLLPERPASPQERERLLRTLVQRILSGYPPQ